MFINKVIINAFGYVMIRMIRVVEQQSSRYKICICR